MERAGEGGQTPGTLCCRGTLLGWAAAALLLAGGCPSRGLEEQQPLPAPTTQRAVAAQPSAPAAQALPAPAAQPSAPAAQPLPAPAAQPLPAPAAQPSAPAAQPLPAPEPAAAERVWVSKQLSGGRQCEPPAPGEAGPPSLAEVQAQLPVPVRDARREQLPVAALCGGAAWAYTYELLIDRQHLPAARQAGFAPPP